MGCHLSKQDEVVTPSPNYYNHTAKPILETDKAQNERHQSNVKDVPQTPRTTLRERVRQMKHHGKSLSPIYTRLPKKARKGSVKNVYDGDTLTLRTNKRVRFLGIDTPELKNPTQAFSEEAKAYTVKRCLDQQIWISYEEGHEMTDRFGRLLCWVWVQISPGKYECVNEGLVKEGLATVYTPSKGSKLANMDKLLTMQKEARTSRKGMWRNFKDYEVVKPKYGAAFHNRNCQCKTIKKSKDLTPIMASEAMDEGRHACRTCLAE